MDDNPHILVEDEPKIRSASRDFLKHHCFRVREPADSLIARPFIKQHTFDLTLPDAMLAQIVISRHDQGSGR